MTIDKIECPYCKKVQDVEEGNTYLDMDTAKLKWGMKCLECKKDFTVVFVVKEIIKKVFDYNVPE